MTDKVNIDKGIEDWDAKDLRSDRTKPIQLEVYTDGSYNSNFQVYGGGIVVIVEGYPDPLDLKVSGNKKEFSTYANAAGELLAAMQAIKLAVKLGATSLKIHHDYMGVRAWTLPKGVNGSWRPKVELTKAYAAYVNSARVNHGLLIDFVHVKAHKGDALNNRADALAKEAVRECIKSLGIS